MKTDDWRLFNQENYLKGVILIYRDYRQYAENKSWDHDHCEFCTSKFSLTIPDTLREGYTTEDDYYWICKNCYEDFKDTFEWEIRPN